ncbi:MAG: hypothetical protein PHN69_06840 [Candidatus Pacebacteria bacterium]|nr:hypothetical protein [Candidatus Paceibacterota bacterium]
MENLNLYKKYYFLEDYLFQEITNNFNKNHYLTDEEFFSIIIWKSNRAKGWIVKGIKKELKEGRTIKDITEKIYEINDNKNRIIYLDKIYGIGIPIASAILTVCYPNDFTISDYRAQNSVRKIGYKGKDITLSIRGYFEYLDFCKKLSKENNLSLRDLDRCLFAKDFKRDLDILIKEVNNSG